MDELDQDFIDEVSNMRMESAYKRLLKTRTHIAAKSVSERDDAIDVLYEKTVKECTEAGQKYFTNMLTRLHTEKVKMPISITKQVFLMVCN